MKRNSPVKVAIIGGSGLYQLEGLKEIRKIYPNTPFGKPSAPLVIGRIQDVDCAFLPRHGLGHRYLPSEIPQRANFYALKKLGVEYVIALSACGSLKEELAPRHFVIPDQILDRTNGRPSTFFGEGIVAHVSFAEPFSKSLAKLLVDSAKRIGVSVHEHKTYVCMDGPAFSTKAESRVHQLMGGDIIGMTAIPEAKLAREAEMSYGMVAMVTDYDCWKEGEAVSVQMVIDNLMANAENAKKLIADVIPRVPQIPNESADALKGAIFTNPSVMRKSTMKKLSPLIQKYVGHPTDRKRKKN